MGRRVVSVTGIALALPLWLATSPVWVPVTVAVDAVSGLRRFPTVRLGLFASVYLAHDWAGMGAAGWLWVTGRFGRRLDLHAHRQVQGWWANSLVRWAGRLLGVRIHFDDPTGLPPTTFVMLSRHASMVDAVIPAGLVAGTLDRFAATGELRTGGRPLALPAVVVEAVRRRARRTVLGCRTLSARSTSG